MVFCYGVVVADSDAAYAAVAFQALEAALLGAFDEVLFCICAVAGTWCDYSEADIHSASGCFTWDDFVDVGILF